MNTKGVSVAATVLVIVFNRFKIAFLLFNMGFFQIVHVYIYELVVSENS